jgi:type VI secretion system protein ImpE
VRAVAIEVRMTAQELFDKGQLAEAIQQQNEQVRAHPADQDERYFLVVLLAFAGELDRAFLQLQTIDSQNPDLSGGTTVYRGLLSAEAERWAVFHGAGRPLLPPDCPAHVESRLEVLEAVRTGDAALADAALERANEHAPELQGKLNGEAFEAIRDYDDVLGPVLEVYAGGKYLWLPFDHIRQLDISEPEHQLDLLWAPAKLLDAAGEEASVHLPVLYEGSSQAEDGRARIGRLTEWVDWEDVVFRGVGQKTLLCAQADELREKGLLEVRTLELADAPSGGASDG